MSQLLRGYVIEERRGSTDALCYKRPILALPKYNKTDVTDWGSAVWVCGYGGEGRNGLSDEGKTLWWKKVSMFQKRSISIHSVALGGNVSVFLSDEGAVYTCGFARKGQLGIADRRRWSSSSPVYLGDFGGNIVQVAAGLDMCFALSSSGLLYSWGSGKHGKLGLGDCNNQHRPRVICPLAWGGAIHISAGANHAHAITVGGGLFSWGLNDCGQLGVGHHVKNSPVPLICSTLRGWKGKVCNVATSSYFTMAVVKLPAIPNTPKPFKTKITENMKRMLIDLADIFKIEMKLKSSDIPNVWKLVEESIRGIIIFFQNRPALKNSMKSACGIIAQVERLKSVCTDWSVIIGVTNNYYDALFKLLNDSGHTPKLSGNQKLIQIFSVWNVVTNDKFFYLFSPGILNSKLERKIGTSVSSHEINRNCAVFVWGYGDIRLGLGQNESQWFSQPHRSAKFRHQFLPRLHRPLSQLRKAMNQANNASENPRQFCGVQAISLGDSHGLALSFDKRVYVWGKNTYGQLGYRFTLKTRVYTDLYEPKEILYLKGCVQIACGKRHARAWRDTGDAYSWGFNNFGQLGHGAKIIRALPCLCLKLHGVLVQHIAAGFENSSILTA